MTWCRHGRAERVWPRRTCRYSLQERALTPPRLRDQAAGRSLGFANPLFYANPDAFYDVLPVKTAVARRNFNNGVDASAGTADRLRTFDDYSGSPTQHTNPGWDNVTGLGTPGSSFLSIIGHK